MNRSPCVEAFALALAGLLGVCAGCSVNGSRRTTLGYDAATSRLVTMNEGGSFAWRYLDGSHLKSRLTYPNGITVDYTYEPNRDLLTGVRNARGETVYSEYLYANDALGRRTARNAERYGYNARSELVSAATDGTNDYAYAYDDIGNRLSSTEPDETLEYIANNLNQYASISNSVPSVTPCEAFNPSFDVDGNQTLVRTATGIWSVSYNAENRPVRWTRGNTVVTMDFDSMGRRTFYREMEGNRQITFTRFFYDGYLMIQQLFSNSPYNVYKEFIWDPTEPVATKPLCFRQNGQAATFLTHDGNKNVTDVIRVAPYNDSVGHYEYAPFGAVRSQTGNRAASNPYRFSSEFADDTLGLVYYNYRHYEPIMGRWLTRDYLEEDGGLGLYVFANNGLAAVDVLGLSAAELLLNDPKIKESPSNEQPVDNPNRKRIKSAKNSISLVDVVMDLGITDPVVSFKIDCKCTRKRGQFKIVGSVDLNIEIRYVQEDAKGRSLGKRTKAGVAKTLKHEHFHAEYFSERYKAHIGTLQKYKTALYSNMPNCTTASLVIKGGLRQRQSDFWAADGEYNHSSERWKEWLEKNGGGCYEAYADIGSSFAWIRMFPNAGKTTGKGCPIRYMSSYTECA